MYSGLELRRILSVSIYRDPVESYGILPVCVNTGTCMMIQRKHTLWFLLLLRGKVTVSCVPHLMKKITTQEFNLIESILGNQEKYINLLQSIYKSPKYADQSWTTFNSYSPLLCKCVEKLRDYPRKEEPPFLWPKGVKDSITESNIDSAARELKEESGVENFPDDSQLVMSEITYTNTGIDRDYSVTFWIMLVTDEIQLTKPHVSDEEVIDRRWVKFEEVPQLLDSDTERDAFKKVIEILQRVG